MATYRDVMQTFADLTFEDERVWAGEFEVLCDTYTPDRVLQAVQWVCGGSNWTLDRIKDRLNKQAALPTIKPMASVGEAIAEASTHDRTPYAEAIWQVMKQRGVMDTLQYADELEGVHKRFNGYDETTQKGIQRMREIARHNLARGKKGGAVV